MATFALVHGGGTSAATFDGLVAALARRGHSAIAVDLPITDAAADLDSSADVVAAALEGMTDVVVVGHSWGGLSAPLVAARRPVELLVFMSALIPAPGETAQEWWETSGWSAATAGLDMSDDVATYMHDLTPEQQTAELAAAREHIDAGANQSWPLPQLPAVPTRSLIFVDDAFLPAAFQRQLAADRLGSTPVEMPGSHMAYVASPDAVATRLVELWEARHR